MTTPSVGDRRLRLRRRPRRRAPEPLVRRRCAAGSTAGTRSTRSASTRSSSISSRRSFSALVRVDVERRRARARRTGRAVLVANRGLGVVEPAALGVAVRARDRPPAARRRRARRPGRSAASRAASARSARARPTCAACLRAGHLVAVPLAPTWLRTGAGTPPLPLMQAMTHAPSIPVAVTPGGPFGTPIRPWQVRFGPLGHARPTRTTPTTRSRAARFAEAVRDAVAELARRSVPSQSPSEPSR